MGLIHKDTFICLDCETTGLEPEKDRIIEIAVVKFNFDGILESYETLVDPVSSIPQASKDIHHITEEMVKGKPKIKEIIPSVLKLIGHHTLIGHGIGLDISFLITEARRNQVPCALESHPYLDTLRMARLYGESPINSLEKLREHFNIAAEGAHRAMNDVVVNIEVFKQLSSSFKTTEQLVERLKKPIALKTMPLGKHKGRSFSSIPLEYLVWASHKNFDQDLLYSLRSEIKRRKQGNQFQQATNPFSNL